MAKDDAEKRAKDVVAKLIAKAETPPVLPIVPGKQKSKKATLAPAKATTEAVEQKLAAKG